MDHPHTPCSVPPNTKPDSSRSIDIIYLFQPGYSDPKLRSFNKRPWFVLGSGAGIHKAIVDRCDKPSLRDIPTNPTNGEKEWIRFVRPVFCATTNKMHKKNPKSRRVIITGTRWLAERVSLFWVKWQLHCPCDSLGKTYQQPPCHGLVLIGRIF